MEKKPKYGFVTMTFDSCHEGHFELLKSCKARCEYLYVGLTTDERAIKEKRQPVLTYSQRFSILSHCKYVDEVKPNNGEPKAEMYKKLKFDILFSGDDYFHSEEFALFRNECPHVPVVFFPRYASLSSTELIHSLMQRLYQSQEIVAPSIHGYIFRQGYGKPFHVTKCLPYSRFETRSSFASNDVFGFYQFDQLPRNWKFPGQESKNTFPMISGIHANREILINVELQKEPWCTYVSHNVVYDRGTSEDKNAPKFENIIDFANFVSQERNRPSRVVQLVQRDAGITLEEWCEHATKEDFDRVVDNVENTIIARLGQLKIVHSDIHPKNVLVDPKTKQVSLIDFGWVTANLFELCSDEKKALTNMLQSGFDLHHFRQSLLLFDNTRKFLTKDVQMHI